MLKSMAGKAAPGRALEMINSMAQLEPVLETAAVLLVNRVLDGKFASDSGIELIELISGRDGRRPPMILVSNLEDAQAQAESAGAMPGFGKSDLYAPTTVERVQAAIGAAVSG